MDSESVPRKNNPAARWLWAGAALAAVIVVGMLTRPVPPQSEAPVEMALGANPWANLAKLEPPPYQPAPPHADPTKADLQFQTAMAAYARHDYPQAIKGLETALALDPAAPAPRFYLGVCHLLTFDAARAVDDLETVAAADSPFAQQAQYDLAKAYLLQGHKALAVDALQRLSNAPSDFREAARQLLSSVLAISPAR